MNEAGSPLVNGYFWEATILIGCAVLIGGRFLFQRTSIQRISLRQWLIIALCSAPTIAGTACYSMATLLGPVAVINSIGTGSLVFTSLLGWWWYGEKLHGKQWLAIGLVMAGIVGLKFV